MSAAVEKFQNYLARDADYGAMLAITHRYYFGAEGGQAQFATLPSYFTPASSAAALAAGMSAYFQTQPPTSNAADETTYAYWPITDSAGQSDSSIISSTWSGRRWWWLWANRWTSPPSHANKANPVYPTLTLNGKQCRIEYTSRTKADAATKVRAMRGLGYSQAEYEAVASAAGFTPATDLIPYATLAASPATYFTGTSLYGPGTYNVMTDKIYLNDLTVSSAASYEGITLDYEEIDGDSPDDVTTFLVDLAATVQAKGKKLTLYTNAYDAVTAPFNGFNSTSLPIIGAAVDYIGVLMISGTNFATTFATQIAMLGAGFPMSKVIMVFDCASSLADATTLRGLMVANGITKVMFYANLQPFGGSDPNYSTNSKINMLVFGV